MFDRALAPITDKVPHLPQCVWILIGIMFLAVIIRALLSKVPNRSKRARRTKQTSRVSHTVAARLPSPRNIQAATPRRKLVIVEVTPLPNVDVGCMLETSVSLPEVVKAKSTATGTGFYGLVVVVDDWDMYKSRLVGNPKIAGYRVMEIK